MKRITTLLIIAVLLVGCTKNIVDEREADVIGLIYSIDTEGNSILVVSDIEDVNVPYEEWFEAGNYAVFFRVGKNTTMKREKTKIDFSSLVEGQKVKVWHTGVLAESYPMQGEAVHIEVVD